jgi:uncharacterized GH25 family protein
MKVFTRTHAMVTARRAAAAAVLVCGLSRSAWAHDTWVQISSPLVRPGDRVDVDLVLGNHGNDHRDFKIAGKVGLEGVKVEVLGPDGRRTDLVPDMVDLGYAPKEGYWTAGFVPAAAGLYCVDHFRQGIRHGSMGFKGGKAFFLVSQSLDRPALPSGSLPGPLGHPLEIVLETHPVLECGPDRPIAVRVLCRGEPLAGQRVSFIPRGTTLTAGFDPDYERMTDGQGRCRFTPREGNRILVVTHLEKPEERGEGYEKTTYAATLILDVPQRCPCCGSD